MSDPTRDLLREAAEFLALRPSGHTGSLDDRIPWFTHGAISDGEGRPDCVVCQWLDRLAALSTTPAPSLDVECVKCGATDIHTRLDVYPTREPLALLQGSIGEIVRAANVARIALAALSTTPAPVVDARLTDECLDVLRLRRALERGLAAVDDEWTIEELAEISSAEYCALGAPGSSKETP